MHASHLFAAVYSMWTGRTVEHMIPNLVPALKVLLNDGSCLLLDWVLVVLMM